MKRRPSARDWISLILVGAAIGTLILGVGGRIAMRVIALDAGAPAGWSLGGTATVLALGAASGAAGAAIRLLSAWLVPGPRWAETVVFGVAVALLTLRGLSPMTTLSVALFGPLVLAYAVMLETLWQRAGSPRGQMAADAASRAG